MPRFPHIKNATPLLARGLALLLAAYATLAVAQPAHHGGDWRVVIALSPEGGHVLGNPAATLKIVEYMSYTCPHCAAFEMEGVPALRLGYVQQGKVSLEIRHLLRDPIDVTIAQLTNCVPPQHFMVLHEEFLRRQDQLLARAQQASPAQTERWEQGPDAQRFRAIAGDLGLYAIMEEHGVHRVEADHCLANEALSHRLAGQTAAAAQTGINGTPSFLLNGMALAGTHNWATLEPQLRARL